jgi:glycosyltransferase involved in cell wall biosynthesis
MVSIFMMTYNHEKYIAQALDSVLKQKVDFQYEIVLGEDCSTDNTRKIVVKYAKLHPGKFKLLLHKTNIGAINNQYEVFRNCTGKYIAMLEGDDYWTDPLKLQKQVDFLEANPDFAICGHQTLIKYDAKFKLKDQLFSDFKYNAFRGTFKNEYLLEDLLRGNVIHLSSAMLVNKISQFPRFLNKVLAADMVILPLYAEFGKVYVMSDVMSVYRNNASSLTNSQPSWTNKINRVSNMIYMYQNMNRYFNGKYKYIFYPYISKYYIELVFAYFNNNNSTNARRSFSLAYAYDKKSILTFIAKIITINKDFFLMKFKLLKSKTKRLVKKIIRYKTK